MAQTATSSDAPQPEAGQDTAIAFLAEPANHAPRPARVERLDTHSAHVFLAGAHAYKIKRQVAYPFLDFSTLEKRRRACLNELRVNRRTAPELYLDVLPITQDAEGKLHIGGEGRVVEWVVKMRRFDQETLYDRKAEEGALQPDRMEALADAIHHFHQEADRFLSPDNAIAGMVS